MADQSALLVVPGCEWETEPNGTCPVRPCQCRKAITQRAKAILRSEQVSTFADGMADYLATRNKPWRDEDTMREAVSECFRVMFGDPSAFESLRRLVAQIDEA